MEALLQSLDIGAALVMSHVDLASLRDPGKLPALTEQLDAKLVAATSTVLVEALSEPQGKGLSSGKAASEGKEVS